MAWKFFHEMKSQGLMHDDVTDTSMIRVLWKAERLDEAVELFEELDRNKSFPCVAYNTMILKIGKRCLFVRFWPESKCSVVYTSLGISSSVVGRRMVTKSIKRWCSLIITLKRNLQVVLWDEGARTTKGLQPTVVTYGSVIDGTC